MAKKPAKPEGGEKTRSASASKRKPPAKAKTASGAGGAAPMIDTSLAANAAAAFVANRVSVNAAPSPARPESANFKHLKESVAKPHTQGLNNILDSTNQNKKPNLPVGGTKQVAHNQTYNADVTRSGVPRRNAG